MKQIRFNQPQFGLLVLVLIGILGACKGPQGDTGPQGAAGSAGAAGAIGPAGPQGATGSASLIVSSWTMVSASAWKSDNDPLYFYTTFEDKNITQAILDKGFVMAYYRNPTQPGVVISLPSTTKIVSIGYLMRLDQGRGLIYFDLSFFQPRNVPIDFNLDVRWVIVPPNPGGRLATLDWTNYNAVKQALNLPD